MEIIYYFIQCLIRFYRFIRIKSLKQDYAVGGILSFMVPISAAFFLVLIFHLLNKVGYPVPGPLIEPVFNCWIVFVGILLAVCVFMRQFLILFVAGLISFVGTVLIYVMYVI